MSNCPNKNSKEWKLLVSQTNEDLAYTTWMAHGEAMPKSLKSTSTIKNELGITNNMSSLQVKLMAKRLANYNNVNKTSHSFKPYQIGKADLYNVDLKVNYLPKQVEKERLDSYSSVSEYEKDLFDMDFYMGDDALKEQEEKEMALLEANRSFLHRIEDRKENESDKQYEERLSKYKIDSKNYRYSEIIPIDIQMNITAHAAGIMLDLLHKKLVERTPVKIFTTVTNKEGKQVKYLFVRDIFGKKFVELAKKAERTPEEEAELKLLRATLADVNTWNLFEKAIVRKLKEKGYKLVKDGEVLDFSTKEDGLDVDENPTVEIEDDNENDFELTDDRVGRDDVMKDSLTVSNKDTMSTKLRTFLSSIKSVKESPIYLKSINGLIDFNRMYVDEGVLIQAINESTLGSTTFEEMIESLKATAKAIPDRYYLADVADKLLTSPDEIKNQFTSKFNQQQSTFIIHKFDKKPRILRTYRNQQGEKRNVFAYGDDKKIIFEYVPKVFDSNRNELANNLKNKSKEDFLYKNNMDTEVISDEIKKDAYLSYNIFKNEVSNYVDENGDVLPDQYVYMKLGLDALLQTVNIELSSAALDKLLSGNLPGRKKINFSPNPRNPKSVFNKGLGGLLHTIFTNFEDDKKPELDDIFKSSGANTLFNIEALYQQSYYNTSVLDGKGRKVWGYSAPNPLSTEFYKISKELSNNDIKHLAQIKEDPYRSKSFLLNMFGELNEQQRNQFLENFKYGIVNTLKSGNTDGKELSNVERREFVLTQVLSLLNNSVYDGLNNSWSFKFLTTPSDKSTMYQIQTPDFKVELSNNKPIIGDRTINRFYDYFLGEYDRASAYQKADAKGKELYDSIDNFEPNLFYHFPVLNIKPGNPLWKDATTLNELSDDVVSYVKDQIRKQIQKDIDLTYSKWKSLGLIENDKMQIAFPKSYRSKVPNSVSLASNIKEAEKNELSLLKEDLDAELMYLYNKSDENLTNYLVYEYALNYHLHNIEMQMLFLGDPADFIKNEKAKLKNKPKLSVSTDINEWKGYIDAVRDNISKRMAGIQASGMVGNVEENSTANTIVIVDNSVESKIIDDYVKYLGLDATKFTSIDHMDGQELITGEEDLLMKFQYGKISKEKYESLLNKVVNGHKDIEKYGYVQEENMFTDEDKLIAQAQKPVMFAMIPIEVSPGVTKFKTTYYKSSAFGLYPQFTQGLEIDKIRASIFGLNKKGLRVDRIITKSASKLGVKSPIKGLFSQDPISKRVSIDPTNLNNLTEDNIDFVPREFLRIQLEVPYDPEKEKIRMASQQVKLIFNEILDYTFNGKSVSRFLPELDGKSVTGKELKELHDKTFKQILQLSEKELIKEIGATYDPQTETFRYVNLEKLQKVLVKQAEDQGYDLPSLEGLELTADKKSFKIPLSLNANAERFEKLLLSLVKKVILQKIHGRSFILATETGFLPSSEKTEIKEGEEGNEFIKKNKSNIIFTDSFNEKIGLLPARPNPENPEEVLPAQVLVSFKYKGEDGKLLNIDDYIVEKDGKKMLDTSKMDPEVLRILGIRIPVQGHPSMGSIEIVGFLPNFMADLIIAPQDFTKIFGSDFDIDKLYGYMYNYTVSSDGSLRRYKNKKNEKGLEDTLEDYEGDFTDVLDNLEDIPSIKDLQNKLQDIYHAIMVNTDVWKKSMKGITEGRLTELADNIREHRLKEVSNEYFSPSSEQNKVDEYFENKAGKTGVGIYSVNNTFATVIEGKDIILSKYDVDDKGNHIKVENPLAIIPNGENSKPIYFKTLSGAKGFNRIISAYQSGAVDNAKLKILDFINSNSHTMGVSSIMAMLADDSITHNIDGIELPVVNEDFIVYFLGQPAIIDYINRLSMGNDSISGFSKSFEQDTLQNVLQELQDKGEALDVNFMNKVENYKGFNTDDLKKNIFTPSNDVDFLATQYATLEKFIELKQAADDARSVQYLLNADSQGTAGSLDEALYKRRRLQTILETDSDGNAKGVPSFFNVENLFIEGENSSLSGYQAVLGIYLPIKLFGETNILSSGSVATEHMIKTIYKYNNKDSANYSYKFGKKVDKALLSYLQANPNFEIQDKGKSLFKEKGDLLYGAENYLSLGDSIEEFKKTEEYKKSSVLKPLIESLKIKTVGDAKFVEFQAFTGLINPVEEIIQSLEYLKDTNYPLFEKLVKYTLLMQYRNSPVSLKSFIAPYYLESIGMSSNYRDIANNELNSTGLTKLVSKSAFKSYTSPLFIEQFLQHNPEEALQFEVDKVHFLNPNGGNSEDITSTVVFDYVINEKYSMLEETPTGMKRLPVPYIAIYDNQVDKYRLYKLKSTSESDTKAKYNEIPTLGQYNLEEYDYSATGVSYSLLDSNNPTSSYVEEQVAPKKEEVNNIADQIYSELGNKTASNNVVIKSWGELKDVTKAITPQGVVSTRIKMSTGHFGNPFTSDNRLQNLIQTKSTKESVQRYINWILTGETGETIFVGIQPEELEVQREWILKQLKSGELKNKPILYYKELGEPSHATALDYLINKYDWNNKTVENNQLQKQNIEITNHNYTRQEVQNNPNTAYVFTENTYSITAFPNRAGGGSAIIRGLSNAFAIVTKKKYDYNTKENVDYTDTEVNFKEFTEVNTKLINELKNSGKEKIVFPQGFATDKAKMPTRFAEWLQKELLNNFGLITELNSTKTGLISKNISQVVDNGIDAKTLKRGDIIEFQQQNFQIERVTEEGFDVRDVNTGEVDFITKEDYESENKKELKPKVVENKGKSLIDIRQLPETEFELNGNTYSVKQNESDTDSDGENEFFKNNTTISDKEFLDAYNEYSNNNYDFDPKGSQIGPVFDNSIGRVGEMLKHTYGIYTDVESLGENEVTVVLSTIASDRNLDNPYFKELSKLLLDVNNKTNFLRGIKFRVSSEKEDYYDDFNNELVVSSDVTAEELPYVLLHEVIHAASVSNLLASTEAGVVLQNRINRMITFLEKPEILQKAIDHYGYDLTVEDLQYKLSLLREDDKGEVLFGNKEERLILGPIINFKEFVAMSLGDRQVQEFFDTLEYEDFKGDDKSNFFTKLKEIFTQFLNKLSSILGIDIKDKSLLKEAMNVALDSLEKPTIDKYLYYGTTYNIVLDNNNKGIDVVGYKGKASKKQALLDAYNANPNLDIQSGKIIGKSTVDNPTIQESVPGVKNTFTYNNVTIDTGNIKLNEGQEKALKLSKDAFHKKQTSFVIRGYAGTGKSTSIAFLVKYLKQKYPYPVEVRVSAPTHKAVKVIKAFFIKNKESNVAEFTVAKILGLRKVDGKFEPGPRNKMPTNGLLIVDEASMIDGTTNAQLLKLAEENGTTIIFMGDPAQIPPVTPFGQAFISPSLEFKNDNEGIELTTVMRQKEGNPLIRILTSIRENLLSKSDAFDHIEKINAIGEGISFTNTISSFKSKLESAFQSKDFQEDKTHAKVVTYTNTSVFYYNQLIRDYILEDSRQPYQVGEVLMGYEQTGAENTVINNGQDYTILESVYTKKIVRVPSSIEFKNNKYETTYENVEISGFQVKLKETFDPETTATLRNYYLNNLGMSETQVDKLFEKDSFIINPGSDNTKLFNNLFKWQEFLKNSKIPWITRKSSQDEYDKFIADNQMPDKLIKFPNQEVTTLSVLKTTRPELFKREEDGSIPLDKMNHASFEKNIDYGYAITSHKAQGSTYNTVFVDIDNLHNPANMKLVKNSKGDFSYERNNLMYVALSRTSNKVEAFSRDAKPSISRLVGIASEDDKRSGIEDTKIPEDLSMQYFQTLKEAFYREKAVIHKDTTLTDDEKNNKYKTIGFKIQRVEDILSDYKSNGFSLHKFYDNAVKDLFSVNKLLNNNSKLSIEEYIQVATAVNYYEYLQTRVIEEAEGKSSVVSRELLEKVSKFKKRASTIKDRLLEIAPSSYIAEYNKSTGLERNIHDLLESESSGFGRNNFISLTQSKNSTARTIGKLTSDMVSKTDASLKEHEEEDTKQANKFLEYYDFKDITYEDTYVDDFGIERTEKNFVTRYTGGYYRRFNKIFKEAERFGNTDQGRKAKSNFIQTSLNKISHTLDLRYLDPEEYNKEMHYYLDTANDKLDINASSTYSNYLKEFYKEQFSDVSQEYGSLRADEVIKQGYEKLEEYKKAKQDYIDYVDSMTNDVVIRKQLIIDWLSYNSPFIILNERLPLEKDKGSLLDAPVHSTAKEMKESSYMNKKTGKMVTGRRFVDQKLRKDKGERYLLKKANRKIDGVNTGFYNDKFIKMEMSHFDYLNKKAELESINDTEGLNELEKVPTLFSFLQYAIDRQKYYLSAIPSFLRDEINYGTMIDVEKSVRDRLEDKKNNVVKLFTPSFDMFDDFFEKLKSFWILPELAVLAWDSVVKTVSEKEQKLDINRIDFIRNSYKNNFNPSKLGNTLNKQGLGNLKTDSFKAYLETLRTMAVTYKIKNESESMIRFGEFLFDSLKQTDKDSKLSLNKTESDLVKWTVDNKLYNADRIGDYATIATSKSKLLGIINPIWKLTKQERDKYRALQNRINYLENFINYPGLSNEEKRLINFELDKLNSSLEKIKRVTNVKTGHDVFAKFIRLGALGFATSGRIADFFASVILGGIREAADGRLFGFDDYFKALTHVSLLYSPKTTGSIITVGGAMMLNPAIAGTGIAIRTGAGIANQVAFKKQHTKLTELMKKLGALDFYHTVSDDEIVTNTVKKSVADEVTDVAKLLNPYELTQEVEQINKSIPTLAVVYNTKIKNLAGEEKNLYEAFDVNSDNELVWNESEFGSQDDAGYNFVTGEKMNNLKAKIKTASTNMNGDYTKENTLQVDATIRGKAIILLRRFLAQWVQARTADTYIDENTGLEYMGSYYSLFHQANSFIKNKQFDKRDYVLIANKQAAVGSILTASILLASTLIIMSSGGDDDDDKNDDLIKSMAYFINNILYRSFQDNTLLVDPSIIKQRSMTGIHPYLSFFYNLLSASSAAQKQLAGDKLMSNQELTANGLSIQEGVHYVPKVDKKNGILKMKKVVAHTEYPEINRLQFRLSKLSPIINQMVGLPKKFKPNNKQKGLAKDIADYFKD